MDRYIRRTKIDSYNIIFFYFFLFKMTKVINLIGPPGAGKSVTAALLFARLKILNLNAEYIQEVAKSYVWTKKFHELNNQYNLSYKQYKILKMINGSVDYVITDGPLLNGLYYNRYNPHNVCNVNKTEKFIIDCHNEFDNINIYITRGAFEYEQAGRIQTEEEADKIDIILQEMLHEKGITYKKFIAGESIINELISHII